MSKDDKTRTDLSHLGPPAIARRFSQVSPRDEIAKFEGRPEREDVRRPETVALVEARARIKELEALLAARDEALAAALELTQRSATAASSSATCPECERRREQTRARTAKARSNAKA